MFDIGAFELLIVGVLALIVVGPKDLPRLIRSASSVFRKIKELSRQFRSGLDDLANEVDIDPIKDFKEGLDPFSDLREEEGLKPEMTPEEVTEHILSNKKKKEPTDAADKADDDTQEQPSGKKVGIDD